MSGKLLIFSAPSGSGKTTIVRHLMATHPELNLHFSVSATTRAPRSNEHDGTDYYFLTPATFREKIAAGAFVEYEEVYTGTYYGTLRSEVDSQLSRGENVVFDVDVVGGCNIKRQFGSKALSIFIMPPSIQALRDRLIARGTDSEEVIKQRLAKAEKEMGYAPQFDHIVVNALLSAAHDEVFTLVNTFLAAQQ